VPSRLDIHRKTTNSKSGLALSPHPHSALDCLRVVTSEQPHGITRVETNNDATRELTFRPPYPKPIPDLPTYHWGISL
jgi:hypothetical protein